MPAPKRYTDQQRAEFIELAQEVGIGRAIRQMGYPTWPAAQKWVKAAGVEISLNKIMSEAKKYHTYYEVEDLLVVVEEGIERAREQYVEADLDPDGLKKVAEALQKNVNVWQILQGKSTSINENRSTDTVDVELIALLEGERKRNKEDHDLT